MFNLWSIFRLYNYGIGIHLLETESIDEFEAIVPPRKINPKDNHISFQCTDVELVKKRLKEMGMKYVSGGVEDEGIKVDQVFFHDPDGYMIEICNCENLPVLLVSSYPMMMKKNNNIIGGYEKRMGAIMMESLSMEMMNFSF
ncbi:hypothetical protein Leryth_006807 [Lithospermum erythrorhizon]|nr:hypothetical protein Leryth_006807 [Lithospermum erythrorhizon]